MFSPSRKKHLMDSPVKSDSSVTRDVLSLASTIGQNMSQESDSGFSLPDITRTTTGMNSPIIEPQLGQKTSDDSAQKVQPVDTSTNLSFHPGRADYDVIVPSEAHSLWLEDVEDAELWLVRAPASFDLRSLSSTELDFEGSQIIERESDDKGPDAAEISYSQTDHKLNKMNLVLPSKETGQFMIAGGGMSGKMTIRDRYSVPEPCYTSPPSPSFSLPPNLKLRFTPFGCDVNDDVRDDQSTEVAESSTKKTKKSRKSNKRKSDHEEDLNTTNELDTSHSAKKKKKKDKIRGL